MMDRACRIVSGTTMEHLEYVVKRIRDDITSIDAERPLGKESILIFLSE